VRDGARVLARYVDGVAARVYEHEVVEELAEYSSVPIINALSDFAHPCQALADIMTLQEQFADLSSLTVSYIGDANNVARSLAVACARLGVDYRIAAPDDYQFDPDFEQSVEDIARRSGSEFLVLDDPVEAAREASALYTDTWVSMGQEEEAETRKRLFRGYRIDEQLLDRAEENCVVLHCLPAYRGNEITNKVIEGPQSVVFDQAENRLHAQRALLDLLMGN
jgi:ornithine carbamoyltransferase